MRTQDEIVAHLTEVQERGEDLFGVEQDALIMALTFENAKPFLIATATEEQFAEAACQTDEAVKAEAIKYLDFAWMKANDERSLSASRSISHYMGWLWLICSDADYQRFVDTEYGWYGKTQLACASELLGVPIPEGQEL